MFTTVCTIKAFLLASPPDCNTWVGRWSHDQFELQSIHFCQAVHMIIVGHSLTNQHGHACSTAHMNPLCLHGHSCLLLHAQLRSWDKNETGHDPNACPHQPCTPLSNRATCTCTLPHANYWTRNRKRKRRKWKNIPAQYLENVVIMLRFHLTCT